MRVSKYFIDPINYVFAIVFVFLSVNLSLRFYAGFHYLDVMLSGHSVRLYYVLTTGIAVLSVAGFIGIVWFSKYLKAMLFVFGLSFALFGFQPYTPYSQFFEVIVTFGALALLIVNFKDRCFHAGNRRLLLLLLLYVCLSGLSLLQLPLVRAFKGFELWGASWFFLVFGAIPAWYVYAIASVNKLILFVVFAFLLSSRRDAKKLYKVFFIGILFSAVISVIVGLLDFYGYVPLVIYRSILIPGRLQSTFGHPGWFAEFVTVMMPFILLGFLRKGSSVSWKMFLLAILVISEIALILAQSRAGWVSYPITLVFCWIFFHLIKRDQDGINLVVTRKGVLKVLVSIPVTLLISLIIVFMMLWWWGPSVEEATEKAAKDSAVMSATMRKSIEERSSVASIASIGRSRFNGWRQGIEVGREQAFFGMGYESFRWHKEILEKVEGSYLQRSGVCGLQIDTPHNLFAQLFVSGGFVGLFLWGFVILYTLVLLVSDCIRNKIYFNVCVALSIASFHIFGIFQSMQYVPMIWFLIFLMFGYALTIDDGSVPLRIRRVVSVFSKIGVVLVVIGGIVYLSNFESRGLAEKYGLEYYEKDQDSNRYFGFYRREKWPMGYYRWSGPRASVSIAECAPEKHASRFTGQGVRNAELGKQKAQGIGKGSGQWSVVSGQKGKDDKKDGWMNGGMVEFDFVCSTPGVEEKPVTLTVSLDGERIDEVCFVRKGVVKRQYYVKGNTKDQGHEFLFDVSRTWNPYRMGFSKDNRDLGVAVREIEFLDKMPKEGVGFYDWETWGGSQIPGWPQSLPPKFRWTGMQASMNIQRYLGIKEFGDLGIHPSEIRNEGAFGRASPDEGIEIFLMCSHPEIDKDPVEVEIIGDDGIIRKEVFKDNQWKIVLLKSEELNGTKALTFQVSRTWNPKLAGISEDSRDLGVAVAALNVQ